MSVGVYQGVKQEIPKHIKEIMFPINWQHTVYSEMPATNFAGQTIWTFH